MDNPKGYNLLEVVLWCALIAVLSGVSASFVKGITEQQKLHFAGESFLSTVAAGRFEAVAKNLAIQVRVHPDLRQFALAIKDQEPPFWRSLPSGVKFSKIPTRAPTFYSRGYASPAGSFILKNSRGHIRVIVSVSGRIRWERIS